MCQYAGMSAPSDRTRVRRLADRARYDRETIEDILDAGFVCHVGFVDQGRPVVIPMLYVRWGDHLLLHGSVASRLLRTVGRGVEVCVTVTLLDGVVLARSAFNHSANYRSVVVFGLGAAIDDVAEKRRALDLLVDRLVPGRRDHLRRMTERELAATTVVRVPLAEASAKVRTGPPHDEEEDYDLPIWAGVVPVGWTVGDPTPDPRNPAGLEVPTHVREYRL